MDAMQSNKDEELLPVLGKNADLDSDLVSELQTAPRLAEKSIPVTSTASQSATDPRRLVCSAFCGLSGSGSKRKRAAWYSAELQEKQEQLLGRPDHLISPHVLPDDSPLSMMFTDFKSAVETMLKHGTSEDEVLGPFDPIVDLLFRQRQSTDPFSACTWASDVARIVYVQTDIFTQLANSFLLTRFMRWIVAPSLENYLLLPDIMRPTPSQTRIPHYASADVYPLWRKTS
jgi:hypothetical protein